MNEMDEGTGSTMNVSAARAAEANARTTRARWRREITLNIVAPRKHAEGWKEGLFIFVRLMNPLASVQPRCFLAARCWPDVHELRKANRNAGHIITCGAAQLQQAGGESREGKS